jgi:hypothetical protein
MHTNVNRKPQEECYFGDVGVGGRILLKLAINK